MGSTISVSDETKRELDWLKAECGYRSTGALLSEILEVERKRRFAEASDLFQRKLEEKGLILDEMKREGARIRREMRSE
ncbi:MAG: hypothetical protein MAG715_00769 [Methanonatronarchaeales archaeon]|nr:hypothetical protein [Methanonatronarchaeales archaeon]